MPVRPALTGLLWAVLLGCVQIAGGAQPRPNIVFIYADDHAPWALGVAGHPDAVTPHLDRLARQGARLVNAFTTTPVCSPSRASLMTSRYGSELGITDWINPSREPELGLDPATITWPELLQQSGYRTALVGKWHLGELDRFHPTRRGFDEFMGFRGGGAPLVNPLLEKDGRPQKFEGYIADIVTDAALDVLRRFRDGPFLVCLHFREPHAPWLPLPDEDWAPFEQIDPTIPNPEFPKLDVARVERMTREYLASVAALDRNVGRVLDLLDELKLAEGTVVIYTSDHGYNMGHNGIWHKGNGHWVLTEATRPQPNVPSNQRPNMCDHSIRVPAAIRFPGVVGPGTVIEPTISNLDWYPTLLAIASVELPRGATIRGRNFLPLLRGEPVDWNNDFYAEYSTHHQSQTHMRMYRTAQWKLVRDFLNPHRDELFHLAEDPAETTNLIHDPRPEVARIVAGLHAKILDQMRATGDPALELATRAPQRQ